MSNTRVKVLEIRLDQLETERDGLENRQHRLRMRKSNEQKLMLGSYFHVSDDKFVCEVQLVFRLSEKVILDLVSLL